MRVLSLVTSENANFYRQQIAGLRGRGHDVDVLSVPGQRVNDGTKTGRRPASAYLRYYPRAVLAAAGNYDFVHANYGLTAPPAVVQPFRPAVLTFWGSDLTGDVSRLSRVCARYADAVVVMSEEMADLVDRDCHVIPHGVDFDTFRPLSRTEARETVGWDGEARHVLFPYGPSRSVKDFPRAERIVELARARLDPRVALHTMSGVPHERVPWYMNAADAMLLVSKREGSPNTVKEALACNLPVVSTDVGDLARRLDGVSRSVVGRSDAELADGLVEVLRDGKRSNGREAVADLRLENQLDRIEAVYREVA